MNDREKSLNNLVGKKITFIRSNHETMINIGFEDGSVLFLRSLAEDEENRPMGAWMQMVNLNREHRQAKTFCDLAQEEGLLPKPRELVSMKQNAQPVTAG